MKTRIDALRRVVAVLLQITIPGWIGGYLALLMTLAMAPNIAQSGKMPPPWFFVIVGGAVVGFLTWLIGLIADRVSLRRLVLTVIFSALGLTVSFVLVHFLGPFMGYLRSKDLDFLPFLAVLAAPLAGAMAGYYWLWGKLRVEGAQSAG